MVSKLDVYEYFPFPDVIIEALSPLGFDEVYEILLSLGAIPKPFNKNSRSLDEIAKHPNLGWQVENCLVLPIPGKQHMAPVAASGWGIYRVVFWGKVMQFGNIVPPQLPLISFKYCMRNTDFDEFVKHGVFENDPMREHIRLILPFLQVSKFMDSGGDDIDFK